MATATKQKQSFQRSEVVTALGAKYRALSDQRHTLTDSAVSETSRGNVAIGVLYANKAEELQGVIDALKEVSAALGIDDTELITVPK